MLIITSGLESKLVIVDISEIEIGDSTSNGEINGSKFTKKKNRKTT